MLEFIAGLATGTIAFTALSFALASRKDRKAREQMRRFAEMQTAAWAVQDRAFRLMGDPPPDAQTDREQWALWLTLREARDRAAAAYFAAMGG